MPEPVSVSKPAVSYAVFLAMQRSRNLWWRVAVYFGGLFLVTATVAIMESLLAGDARSAVLEAQRQVERANVALDKSRHERAVLIDSLLCRDEGGDFTWEGNLADARAIRVVCTKDGQRVYVGGE